MLDHVTLKQITRQKVVTMSESHGSKWLNKIAYIDYAFQPIVNIHTGLCYGYEALMRNHQAAGFDSIEDFFDTAWKEGALHEAELLLREKAVAKFARLPRENKPRLFMNMDNRALVPNGHETDSTLEILAAHGLSQDDICFEISERLYHCHPRQLMCMLDAYRMKRYKIAMDDYGVGFSGLQMLYYSEPDIVKIDRFFIQDIQKDPKKNLFVSSIVNIAHHLGVIVVAEGVETEKEYFACKEIGCDMIQGYIVQRPEVDIRKLKRQYEGVVRLSQYSKRKNSADDRSLIHTEMEYIGPISSETENAFKIFEKFRENKDISFFPVVNQKNEPLGVIREKSLKDYAYSRFGKDILLNPAFGGDLSRFITRFPMADIHMSVEKILEIYTGNNSIEGILILDDMKYVGFLSAFSLLKILNEKNIAAARDQNPLTRLPGNNLIYKYVSEALMAVDVRYALIYFDFDNFKPYNDRYGFRNGDRVIQMFSDLLKKFYPYHFVAHVGGDDFFLGVKKENSEEVHASISKLIAKFSKDVESFYDSDAIENGYIVSKDRTGCRKQFPILTVSAVILDLSDDRDQVYPVEKVSKLMAKLKKKAKKSSGKICQADIRLFDKDCGSHSCEGTDAPFEAPETIKFN